MRGAAIAGGAMAASLAISTPPAAAQSQAAPNAQGAGAQKSAEPGKKAEAAKPAKKAAAATGATASKKTSNGKEAQAAAPADAQKGTGTTPPAATGTVAATGGASSGVASATIQDIVVTSRLREENLQDVPVPVTAVSGEDLDKKHQATIKDFAQTSPSLTVNAPNARQSSIAIRGVGKNIANEALEASVGVIVDGVFVALPGMTWGDYSDLERIELIRGPQGTLLGKNTTLGVLNIVTQAPSFTPEREVEVTFGNRDLVITKANVTGPLIDNTLAYRASVYFDRQDPLLDNDAFGFNGVDYDAVNAEADRWGGRLQFLYTPNANITNRTILDHSESDERNTATIKVSDPQKFTDNGAARPISYTSRLARFGYTPNFDPWNSVDLNQQEPTKTEQNGASTQTDWHTDSGYLVTSISAYKDYDFDALNDVDYTRLSITQGGYLVDSWQASQELRLTSPRNQEILGQKFDWQGGLYGLHTESTSTQRTRFGADAGKFYAPNFSPQAPLLALPDPVLSASLANILVRQQENPVTTSLAAYGQATWHATDRADLTLGLRNTYEEKTNWTRKWRTGDADLSAYLPALTAGFVAQGLTPAAAATAAQQTVGGLNTYRNSVAQLFTGGTGRLDGEDINADSWSWLVNPSYKLTDSVLLYASYSHGEKSGAVQFDTVTGAPLNVDPEKVEDYEIGVKAGLFDKSLFIAANLYWTDIEDYQAVLAKPSPVNPALWATYLGNVPGVRLRGVEVEGSYRTPIEGLSLTFGGSYNDGIYSDYAKGQCSGDLSYGGVVGTYCDYTGKTFAGVSRWIGNIGVDYSREVFSGYTAYAFAGNTYRSRVNYGVSDLSVQEGYSITNAGIGLHPNDESWDLSFWGKNVFDTQYYNFLGSFSAASSVVGMAGDPVQYGATLRMKW
jgi:iron complex outermembrane receptor protein